MPGVAAFSSLPSSPIVVGTGTRYLTSSIMLQRFSTGLTSGGLAGYCFFFLFQLYKIGKFLCLS